MTPDTNRSGLTFYSTLLMGHSLYKVVEYNNDSWMAEIYPHNFLLSQIYRQNWPDLINLWTKLKMLINLIFCLMYAFHTLSSAAQFVSSIDVSVLLQPLLLFLFFSFLFSFFLLQTLYRKLVTFAKFDENIQDLTRPNSTRNSEQMADK